MAKRARDLWPELCEKMADDDGLPTRDVGPWSADKLHFWHRYVDITTTSMVGHPKWPVGLVYVDLFAGPGVCTIRKSGERRPGSPLIAANARKPFTKILLCEKDRKLAAACKERLTRIGAEDRSRVFVGDCNSKVSQIAVKIPDGALTLAFVDPTGLHAKFSTIETLSKRGRVDLLILFADYMDIVRNLETYLKNDVSKLDEVMGPDAGWREKLIGLTDRSPASVSKFFAGLYKTQLRKQLGYKKFGEKVMRTKQGPIYRLIYASKHERGLDFWDKATKKDSQGQGELF